MRMMTQPQNPQPSQSSGAPSSPTPIAPSPPANTRSGRAVQRSVSNLLEAIDQLFYGLMGQLGRTVYESIQDAIALSILLTIPSLIGKWIIGKDFASFDVCLAENPLGASRYACFIIVASDFLLWIVLAGRIIGRFWADLKQFWNNLRNP